MIKLLFNFAKDRNSGEFRRVYRISRDFDKILETDTYEILIIPIRALLYFDQLAQFKFGCKTLIYPILLPFSRIRFISKINSWLIRILARYLIWRYKPSVVFGETIISSPVFIKGKHINICDLHGDYIDELNCQGLKKSTLIPIESNENHIIEIVDQLVVQSQAMKQHLLKKYPHLNHNNIIVYNCGVDCNLFDYRNINKKAIRSELQFSEKDIIFVYAGGSQPWQKLYETLKIYHLVKLNISNAKLMLLLQDGEKEIQDFCNNHNIKDVSIFSKIPFRKVHKYLSIANYGFLIREDVQMNRVASPTKLGEYLACGLIVITTSVASHWEWLPASKCIIIDLNKSDMGAEEITRHISSSIDRVDIRDEMRKIALNNLSDEQDYLNLSTHIIRIKNKISDSKSANL